MEQGNILSIVDNLKAELESKRIVTAGVTTIWVNVDDAKLLLEKAYNEGLRVSKETCPKCGAKQLDHEQEDPVWEHCKFYCYNCQSRWTWEELNRQNNEAKP